MLNARKIAITNFKVIKSEKEFWEFYKVKDIPILSDDKKTILYIDRSINFVKDIYSNIMYIIKKQYKDVKKIIMVINKKVTKTVEKYKKSHQEYKIEFLQYENFYMDITLHTLVPKHILLSDEERNEFLSKSTVSEKDLNKILVTDPVNVWYGGKKGQIYKIIPKVRGNFLKIINYRIVI